MKYKSDLKKNLQTIKLVRKNISYNLSFNKVKDLKKFKRLEILKYINDYYINEEELKKEDLMNDLIAFKTYKDELELIVENQNVFFSVLALLLALLAIATSLKSERLSDGKAFVIFIILLVLIGLIFGAYLIFRENKESDFNKSKVVNNAIHILETIKENMVEVPQTWNFDVEVDNLIGQVSKSRKYSIKVTESLENKK